MPGGSIIPSFHHGCCSHLFALALLLARSTNRPSSARAQPYLVLFRQSDEAFFGRRRTRHEETHQNPISFVTHSLTVQHHGGPSALRRRTTMFSCQTRTHHHVWMQLKHAASSDWPPLRVNATNHRPAFPPHLSAVRFSVGWCHCSVFVLVVLPL